MGQRANLILTRDGDYELYYSHWCANTLPRDLFWGPIHAETFIRSQRLVKNIDWLDDIWAEGGAVLDPDARVLLIFGGEDLMFDVPMRRVYLEMARRTWAGWDVRWAHEGIADIADYVGHPRAMVIAEEESSTIAARLEPPQEKRWTDLVASVKFADGSLRLFPLQCDVPLYLQAGPNLLDSAREVRGFTHFPADGWPLDFPGGGFHIDVGRREVSFWIASDACAAVSRIEAAWPGWSVVWERDRFESQLERTEGVLTFPATQPEEIRSQVVEMLLHENGRSPVDSILELTAKDRAEGKDVQINPFSLRDDPLELTREVRLEILRSIGVLTP